MRGDVLHQPFSWLTGENTNNINPHSKIINSLFWPVSISHVIAECIVRRKKSQASIVVVCMWKRVSSTFPLPVKKCCFLGPFELKIGIFFFGSWYSPDAFLSSWGTMTTLEHPAGAPQLGIPRIVLDIFGFHQSKWLQFSIKMLNLVLEPNGQGRKYEAVPLDDKWPFFDWANREIRATVYRETDEYCSRTHDSWSCVRSCQKWIDQNH